MTSTPPDFAAQDPSTESCVEAVEALVALRTELSRLREREAELCDEIQSYATENDITRVSGVTRDALIEIRHPLRLDLHRLPSEILFDPAVFTCEAEAVVLLAPCRAEEPAKAISPDLEAPSDPFEDTPTADTTPSPEEASSKDLRPTQHVDLQPLAGLPDEDIAAFLDTSDADMPPIEDEEARESATALEAEADLWADTPRETPPLETAPSGTAFSSRRISGG